MAPYIKTIHDIGRHSFQDDRLEIHIVILCVVFLSSVYADNNCSEKSTNKIVGAQALINWTGGHQHLLAEYTWYFTSM